MVTVPTHTSWLEKFDILPANWANMRVFKPIADWCAITSCQRRRMIEPAPIALMVSMPCKVSIATECLVCPSS